MHLHVLTSGVGNLARDDELLHDDRVVLVSVGSLCRVGSSR